MSKSKKKLSGDGWVFAGASDATPETDEARATLPPDQQRIRVSVEKRAKGKVVTLLDDVALDDKALKTLAKKLKSACGTGGTFHQATIELQGDCRDRARAWLEKNGYGLA